MNTSYYCCFIFIYIPSDAWGMDCGWNKVAAHLLKISLAVIWENVLVKGNNHADATIQVFERYGRSIYKRQVEVAVYY